MKTVINLSCDGLLQKAGYPQEGIIEMYGSWFDPSNPVVKQGGSIRQDLWQRAVTQSEEADLCIVIGTSLRYDVPVKRMKGE